MLERGLKCGHECATTRASRKSPPQKKSSTSTRTPSVRSGKSSCFGITCLFLKRRMKVQRQQNLIEHVDEIHQSRNKECRNPTSSPQKDHHVSVLLVDRPLMRALLRSDATARHELKFPSSVWNHSARWQGLENHHGTHQDAKTIGATQDTRIVAKYFWLSPSHIKTT